MSHHKRYTKPLPCADRGCVHNDGRGRCRDPVVYAGTKVLVCTGWKVVG